MTSANWLQALRGGLITKRRRPRRLPNEVEILEPRMVLSADAVIDPQQAVDAEQSVAATHRTTEFVEGQFFDIYGGSGFIPAGDLDGDHDLDLIAAGILLRNDGSGHFTDEGVVLPTSFESGALGDVDGDGDLDAFLVCADWWFDDQFVGASNEVWLNNGDGTFTDSGQRLGESLGWSVALADLNGDGSLDAFVANSYGSSQTVWINDGTGRFHDSGQRLNQPDGCEASVAVGDFDGDGDFDAVVGTNGSTRLWLNDGSGQFADSGQRLPEPGTRTVDAGDLDGDGDLDLYLSALDHDRVFLNDGTGQFVECQILDLDTYASHLGDVDDDGDLDVLLANRNWHGFGATTDMVLLNDGTGHFLHSGQEVRQVEGRGVDLADFDGDGDLDAYSPSDNGTRIWINQPSSKANDSSAGQQPYSAESGDTWLQVDGDQGGVWMNADWARNFDELQDHHRMKTNLTGSHFAGGRNSNPPGMMNNDWLDEQAAAKFTTSPDRDMLSEAANDSDLTGADAQNTEADSDDRLDSQLAASNDASLEGQFGDDAGLTIAWQIEAALIANAV